MSTSSLFQSYFWTVWVLCNVHVAMCLLVIMHRFQVLILCFLISSVTYCRMNFFFPKFRTLCGLCFILPLQQLSPTSGILCSMVAFIFLTFASLYRSCTSTTSIGASGSSSLVFPITSLTNCHLLKLILHYALYALVDDYHSWIF